MRKIVILGNSASGKSTLAQSLSQRESLPHLDLDVLAWQPLGEGADVPARRALEDSGNDIRAFISEHTGWLVEGCYADLLELVTPQATEMIYLNPPIETCVRNARRRDWEPHKYPSREAQDKNLPMLIEWIRAYKTREDTLCEAAHQQVYAAFKGHKRMLRELEVLTTDDPQA